ncbi:hypothetical protein THAOC_30476 [Thalassiosira oceanica]|uniref:Uncharacterized protein n=1 Tax=Thalassiosira oceanica TaxID=159749 RepID=K0RUX6_THAOC|nr:hypothetical protein THAOC_30476 [Thalassiosira oceanica]|eukprot:EJK50522.1 hypothetical protein THAOC_30476 [Thalassiosira oceanica]
MPAAAAAAAFESSAEASAPVEVVGKIGDRVKGGDELRLTRLDDAGRAVGLIEASPGPDADDRPDGCRGGCSELRAALSRTGDCLGETPVSVCAPERDGRVADAERGVRKAEAACETLDRGAGRRGLERATRDVILTSNAEEDAGSLDPAASVRLGVLGRPGEDALDRLRPRELSEREEANAKLQGTDKTHIPSSDSGHSDALDLDDIA